MNLWTVWWFSRRALLSLGLMSVIHLFYLVSLFCTFAILGQHPLVSLGPWSTFLPLQASGPFLTNGPIHQEALELGWFQCGYYCAEAVAVAWFNLRA